MADSDSDTITVLARQHNAVQTSVGNPREELLERSSSLGRVLQPTWQDNASPLYDCFDSAFRADQDAVAPWLSAQLEDAHAHNTAPLRAAEDAFAHAMDALHAEGVHADVAAFDPTDADAPLPAHRLAREARRAWQHLVWTRAEAEGWDAVLEGAADWRRAQARAALEMVRRAHELHQQFVAEAMRRALRWRVVGRTVVGGVRWVHRALRRGLQAE